MDNSSLLLGSISSESTSTVRVSSPLNPTTEYQRSRLHSTPTLRGPSSSRSASSTLVASIHHEDDSNYLSRLRTSSNIVDDTVWKKVLGSPSTAGDRMSDWWRGETARELPKCKAPLPEEELAWEYTKKRVANAARSAVGTALDVGHEALILSADLLEFAPVPGLQNIARTLLHIWDSARLMDMNRVQARRLTERCAEVLLSVRYEIREIGDTISEELSLPLYKLSQAFDEIVVLLQKQITRPFLKRFLKREEIRRQMAGCDQALHDALEMFGLRVQFRILKQVQAAEWLRTRDMQILMAAVDQNGQRRTENVQSSTAGAPPSPIASGLPPSSSHASLVPPDFIDIPTPLPPDHLITAVMSPAVAGSPLPQFSPLGFGTLPAHLPPAGSDASSVFSTLIDLRAKQNEHDAALDLADLRCLLRTALTAECDAEMLDTLGIRRNEMAEALKTLQRALESIMEKHGAFMASPALGGPINPHPSADKAKRKDSPELPTTPSLSSSTLSKRRLSMQGDVSSSLMLGRGRSKTFSTTRRMSAYSLHSPHLEDDDDTLEQEFIESGIDALRRMSRGSDMTLPSWTITRFEVDREHKIGVGFFSDVFKGSWNGRAVAIKVLADTTPRPLFVREVEIWKGLSHPNVLSLHGASSTSGDPPWFFVSPYAKNGSLAEFLRRVDSDRARIGSMPESQSGRLREGSMTGLGLNMHHQQTVRGRSGSASMEAIVDPKGWDLLRFMSEIGQGMEYLHDKGVLHGDLKAANVLVGDRYQCLITDFGQSEMRSEAYRISGTDQPHGTLRWQAPELMMGHGHLTPEVDAYAFAICCIEVLSMGKVPWALMDDSAVRYLVIQQDSRPTIPLSPYSTPALQKLIRSCWDRDPRTRPDFGRISESLWDMEESGIPHDDSRTPVKPFTPPLPDLRLAFEEYRMSRGASPDMRVHSNPYFSGAHPLDSSLALVPEAPTDTMPDGASFHTAREPSLSPPQASSSERCTEGLSQDLQIPGPHGLFAPQPAIRVKSTHSDDSDAASSLQTDIHSEQSSLYQQRSDCSSHEPGDRVSDRRDERRYRLLLSHKFHPSLTLPLWTPSKVFLGAVGYLSKPEGKFITLFNAISPERSPNGQHPIGLPKIGGYGDLKTRSQKTDVRNAARRGFDVITGMFRKPDGHSRFTHPLRAGHKEAFLYTESTVYKYLESLDVAKLWFKKHVDQILNVYGLHHDIHKEELFLVIGTLDTSDYALFVSHNHPDGEANFNLLPPLQGKPWGIVKTDTQCRGGPSYHEPVSGGALSSNKVSKNGDSEATVLLARLRFRPDVEDPTST